MCVMYKVCLGTKYSETQSGLQWFRVCVFILRSGSLVVTVLRESNHGISLLLLTVCAPYLTKVCRRQPLEVCPS